MPLPIIFITAAAASGLLGAGKTAKAIADNNKANQINTIANETVNVAQQNLESQREAVSESLSNSSSLSPTVSQKSPMLRSPSISKTVSDISLIIS